MNARRLLLVVALLAAGCGDTGGTDDMSRAPDLTAAVMPDMTVRPDLLPPAPPVVGEQIDRMGRPAINTALTDPFNFDMMRDMVQDDYNRNGDPTSWQRQYAMRFAGNLAIFDVLDGSCGNQLLYMPNMGGPNYAAAGYLAMGGALADDELYVNTAASTCSQYLAVELTAINMKPDFEKDCGGRTPTYDVIDWSYGVLSGKNTPVTDNVPTDTGSAPTPNAFPFFGNPEM